VTPDPTPEPPYLLVARGRPDLDELAALTTALLLRSRARIHSPGPQRRGPRPGWLLRGHRSPAAWITRT
jgi:hypothetical protein